MPDLADVFPGYCSHCGGTHSGECGVKAATRSILANWRPRGATAGFDCPNGHGDGIWHWGPQSKSFRCEVCGVLVDPHSGELFAEQDDAEQPTAEQDDAEQPTAPSQPDVASGARYRLPFWKGMLAIVVCAVVITGASIAARHLVGYDAAQGTYSVGWILLCVGIIRYLLIGVRR